ncbi:alanine racemase [Microbacterium sp.]|uniref:alanine racemase n=1 Tax=Microbacterium sp. TaxID=51671 RepID=UPI0039E30F3C
MMAVRKGERPDGALPLGRPVLDAGLTTPILTVDRRALQGNIDAMAAFLAGLGVGLAPHVKTHMSPQVWEMQRRAGAERCTVATVAQALVMAGAGGGRLLIASEIVAGDDLDALVARLASDTALDVIVFCDSVDGVRALSDAAARASGEVVIGAVVDVGASGWRTGVRTAEAALAVARAVAAAPHLRLEGLAGYEGVLWSLSADEGRDAAVAAYLDRAIHLLHALQDARLLPGEPLVTFGGSDLYPAVLERLLPAVRSAGGRLVLRSGCYAFHDHGKYAAAQREIGSAFGAPRFAPAITVWAPVVSAPERGVAVVAAGRRDLGADAGLPVALHRHRSGRTSPLPSCRTDGLYDQHLVLGSEELRVGDLVGLGISHPCTTLDRYRSAWLVDGQEITGRLDLLFP